MAIEWENGRWDFLEWLGQDLSSQVLGSLDDPADLVRASAVSRSWRRSVIGSDLSKNLCLKLLPEASIFTHLMVVTNCASVRYEIRSSATMEFSHHEMKHRVFTHIMGRLKMCRDGRGSICPMLCLGASSTDRYPDERIENTLERSARVDGLPSYWSSAGHAKAEIPESLTYQLKSKLCLIKEIRIRPFQAYFEPGRSIYSASAVRIRLGYSKLPSLLESSNLAEGEAEEVTGYSLISMLHYLSRSDMSAKDEAEQVADSNFVWTYVSPEFSMAQENSLQTFKLPRPVLCVGGALKIDLLGRIERHFIDDLYYICITCVEVVGIPLSPVLIGAGPKGAGYSILKYFPAAKDLVLKVDDDDDLALDDIF